jgi:GNAT superfamily N-acetyltransferase
MLWPVPLPLLGVKSKKQAVFGVRKAVVLVNGKPCEVADVTVSLQSRICAVGEAGRAVAALLLGEAEPISGEVSTRHASLSVAHLHPQNSFETAREYDAFIADAVAKRPHVVVVEEDVANAGQAWANAFRQITREDMSTFQGAIVICCSDANSLAQLYCSTRWMAIGSRLQQEDISQVHCADIMMDGQKEEPCQKEKAVELLELTCQHMLTQSSSSPRPEEEDPAVMLSTNMTLPLMECTAHPGPEISTSLSNCMKKHSMDKTVDTMILDNVQVCSEEETPGTYLGALFMEVTTLSRVVFQEDAMERIRSKPAGKNPPLVLALLVRKSVEKAEDKPDNSGLLGFLMYSLWGPPVRHFTIFHLAVPAHLRGRGYGKQIIEWAKSRAKALPRSVCGAVTCSSFAEVIPFYRQLGFDTDKRAEKDGKLETATPGQLLMKYKCGRPHKAKKSTK